MDSVHLAEIKAKITAQHEGDEKQLEVIFSHSPRLMVEAPAGYGKTTTMISRIAYLFASGQIPNPKRIMGLTFSVNAALKVKREISEKLPGLLGSKNNPVSVGEKVTVTNYHGFCKGVLKKYGYLIADALRKDVNSLRAINDSEIEKRSQLKTALTSPELQILQNMERSVKEAHFPDDKEIHEYNSVVIEKLLPMGYITHNAVVLFVLEIFNRNKEVVRFYQNYYPLIVVDEFQDTNCISWMLLQAIISSQTQLLFLGDSLQRIYGFIGALPDIMSKAADEYQMIKIALSKNYRFSNNPEMLKLDKSIRDNATSRFAPNLLSNDVARLPIFWVSTQQEEAEAIVTKIQSLMRDHTARIAVLFYRRGKNAEVIESEFIKRDVPYFYGMFTEDDADYVDFHNKCQDMFVTQFSKSQVISRRSLIAFADKVKTAYAMSEEKTIVFLCRLLDAFVEKVSIDYADLLPEDKYNLLLDVFENRQLKQAMEYVKSQVILSTVHGAKGLEWDYVIVCDVEQWAFPSPSTCYQCPSKWIQTNSVCRLPQIIPAEIIRNLLDDFCVFYVALTRAKKQAFISASKERFNFYGRQFTEGRICCFASVNGVKLVDATHQNKE